MRRPRTLGELFALLDAPYVRWRDADNVVHAVGQSIKGSQTFCDRFTGIAVLREGDTSSPVDCMGCYAQAEERGILP
jgi:hypothetical protein